MLRLRLRCLFSVAAISFGTVAVAAPPPAPAGVPDPLAFTGEAGRAVGPVVAHHGMVVSAQHLASEIGARILSQGGNAADAAVAVGYALAVVFPAAGNIGGGGFMTLRPANGPAVFIDFREHAPLSATEAMFQDGQGKVVPGLSINGWKAVAVPGTVAGLDMVLHRYGRLSRARVMAPAIALARDGFVLQASDTALINKRLDAFQADPEARHIFLRPDGTPLQPGDRLVQKELATSLEAVAKGGPDAFYHGPIAREIARASAAGGGLLTTADFAAYHTRVLPPITCHYRGYDIETAPPPSGGGVALCEILNILSGYDMHALGLHSAARVEREAEAMQHAYSDRRDLGDPAFVNNPIAHLTDPAYADEIRRALPTDGHAIASARLVPGIATPGAQQAQSGSDPERHETTQYSIMDRGGMAVSVTYTLNGWFGAGVMGGHTGIWMNDEMDDFSSKPGASNMFGIVGSKADAVAPGKTPLSSMSPTIVSRDSHAVMVIGSPGGSRIPTITLSAILGVIDYGLDVQAAIDLPRIHEQWMPEAVQVEKDALTPDTLDALKAAGYEIDQHGQWGAAEGVIYGAPTVGAARTGLYYGGVDLRRAGGSAVGE